jgi:Flp pilus assembly protein TadG
MSKLADLIADRRGGAIIEFAVLCPFLFTLVLGAVDVGRMFYVRQSLEYATEEAARYYMLNPSAATSTVTTQLQNKMAGGMGSNVGVSYVDTTSCNGNSSTTCTLITATYNFTFVAGYLGLGAKTLTARAQAVRITG